MAASYREQKTDEAYSAYQYERALRDDTSCPLCGKSSKIEFAHWRIIENIFPYDRIASVHDMIIPKRHVDEFGLSAQELEELRELKYGYINDNYQFLLEPVPRGKTIPPHFHPHLIVGKQ